ncbi:MAG: phenylalanine--tRNA ligase subunit alpha [Planctomycetota bacterium]|nr:phenylalanine--tRNA ligase subunit alpha [Planctomycetota bacterium]
MSLLEELRSLQAKAQAELEKLADSEALEAWRIRYLGTKGALKDAANQLKDVAREQKPAVGKALNDVKNLLTEGFEKAKTVLGGAAKPKAAGGLDVTLPGSAPAIGHEHLISQTVDEICDLFGRMGFTVAYGPEVEDEWHNFDALNTPPEHPARDVLDNFFLDGGAMIRSQTSTVQIRVMENASPPIRIIAPGRVFRPDTVDATHSFMFHQVEGLYVDEGVTMSDLLTCLDQFCKAYFGPGVPTRFRPHFFPFTEPSAEVDVWYRYADGHEGWMELGGCGMVDPNVLKAVKYDAEKYTGFAFGMGIERMVMVRHGIPDIRLLYGSDVRFLHQF